MSKNPIVNALGALAYILLVAGIMSLVSQNLQNKPDTFFAPVAVMSLLTLSAAAMAYIFFYQPVQLYIEGKKKLAVDLFGKTVGVFAALTIAILILIFSGTI